MTKIDIVKDLKNRLDRLFFNLFNEKLNLTSTKLLTHTKDAMLTDINFFKEEHFKKIGTVELYEVTGFLFVIDITFKDGKTPAYQLTYQYPFGNLYTYEGAFLEQVN